ncbi:MAG: globin [Actinomycetota bacterium]
MTDEQQVTLFEAVGGRPFFDDLVDRFYAGVEADERLRPLYPDDLTESRLDLAEFLSQYWGGPPIYSDRKGHPRLRMRHGGFAIGEAEKTAWLTAMLAAVDAVTPPGDIRRALVDYFEMAATHMINVRESPPS